VPSLPSGLVNGTDLIEGPTRLPSNFSRSSCWLSPTSHIQPIEVDERPDLIVVDGGGGDDVAAVRVADEHDRTAKCAQELGVIGGVAEIAKRVGAWRPRKGLDRASGDHIYHTSLSFFAFAWHRMAAPTTGVSLKPPPGSVGLVLEGPAYPLVPRREDVEQARSSRFDRWPSRECQTAKPREESVDARQRASGADGPRPRWPVSSSRGEVDRS
jgi:hypothetical protein